MQANYRQTLVCRLLAVALTASCATAADAPSKPQLNVVVLLVDDLGWKDLGCYGSAFYETPHIDSLAETAVRFTNGYATCSVCSPTRASILTGKYPARTMLTNWLPAGRWNPKKHKLREGRFLRAMPLEEKTLAETLRQHGYKTCFIGKWHLGGEPFYYPRHHGFDINIAGRDYGYPGEYFFPFHGHWRIPTTEEAAEWQTYSGGKEGDHLTDVLTDEAVKYIQASEEPFLLYMSYYAVHVPIQAKEEKILKYKNKKAVDGQTNAAYAAMIETVDDSVGRILKALEEKGVNENTLIVFISDNGGNYRVTDHRPLRGNKCSYYEGGIRVPFMIRMPGAKKAVCDTPVICNDIYPTILDCLGLPQEKAQHLDGLSLKTLLQNPAKNPLKRESLFWHFPHYLAGHPLTFPSSVIRKGDWKLIEFLESGVKELYNLAEDIGEMNDLVSSRPKKVEELYKDLQQWRRDVDAEQMKKNELYEGR